ncbi:hypothetical protein HKD37_04G010776 [Glycine soja]
MVDLKSKLRVKINEYVNLHDPLIVCGLNALHGLGLAGEVKVVIPHDDTGGHDKLTMEAKGANLVEEKEREKPMEGKEAGGRCFMYIRMKYKERKKKNEPSQPLLHPTHILPYNSE